MRTLIFRMVANFAAESHVDRSIEDPGVFLQTNVVGTGVLMDACRKFGITRYHQVSTDEDPPRAGLAARDGFPGGRQEDHRVVPGAPGVVGGDRQRGIPELLPEDVRQPLSREYNPAFHPPSTAHCTQRGRRSRPAAPFFCGGLAAASNARRRGRRSARGRNSAGRGIPGACPPAGPFHA
ncbi:MAG: GDP-mannose 4,6-dehydratase [Victivallales bacterium]|nr:GDP-mannose 4,6-dehydratase [Victivallales bacterium]